MNLKISSISFNKKFTNILNLKSNKKCIDKNMEFIKKEALPIVAIPLIAYTQSKTTQNHLDKHLGQEAIRKVNNNCATTPITDRTETNIKILKKSGLTESEAKKHIDANGYMDKQGKEICEKNGRTGFKGAPEEGMIEDKSSELDYGSHYTEELTGDIPNYQSQLDEMESPVPEVDSELQTELDAIDTDISYLDDLEANLPVIGAVAAEMLPGTRFFKPIKDLLDGDVSKAAIGAGTRACEILLAPLKLGYVGMMGLCSAAYKLCGIDEDYTGFVNGVKLASKNWAEGRDAIEDEILGRETKEAKRQRLEKEIAQKRQVLEEKKARLQEEYHKKIEEKRRIETERNLEEKRRLEALKEEEYRARTWHSQRLARYKLLKEEAYEDSKNYNYKERDTRKSKERDYKFFKAKEGLAAVIEQYKRLYPNADISEYTAAEESWNKNDIAKARKKLQKLIHKKEY